MRQKTRKILVTLAAMAAVSALARPVATAEEFEGENRLLRKLSQQELVTYFGLRYSLNRYQMRQYLTLESADLREEWIDRYWVEHDPTPASPENERRIEHEMRVELARKLFGMKKPPGWDKRGETLIRWGMPSVRTRVPADIGFYEMVPPGELWYYEYLDMIVAFQNYSLSGEFIYAFEDYGMSGRRQQDRLAALANFVGSMSAEQLGTEFSRLTAQELSGIVNFNPDRIDYIADPNVRAETPRDLIAAIERQKQQESRNNFHKYLDENPVIYSVELEEKTLPLFFDVTTFSAGEGGIRTEVNFEVPASELTFSSEGGALEARLRLDVLVRDLDMEEVARVSDLVTPSQSGGGAWQGPGHIPGQLAVVLGPGYYRLGIEATDLGSGRKGGFTTNLQLESLDGRLAMSDILFASTIRKVDGVVRFQKGDLQVVPHPLHAYRIPYPLTFYFEVYGLDTDRDGLAFYSVDYRIIPVTKRRRGPILEEPPPAISSQFETTGFGPTQTQRLEIATGNLWEGAFTLIVEVMDRRTRKTVEKRSNFSVLE